MARALVFVGVVLTLLAAAWLWLADGADRDSIADLASRSSAARPSMRVGDRAELAPAAARETAAITDTPDTDESEVEALETAADAPAFIPHTFIVLGPYQVPIGGAVASFTIAGTDDASPELVGSAVSDSEGKFTARLVAGATHHVHVEAAGFVNLDLDYTASTDAPWWDETLHLERLESSSIEGVVATPDGRTLPATVLDLLLAAGDSGGAPLDPRDSTRAMRATILFEPFGVGTPARLHASFDVRPRVLLGDEGAFAFSPQPHGIAGELRLEWCEMTLATAPWSGRDGRAHIVLDPAQFLGSLCTLDVAVTGFGGASDDDWLTVLVTKEGSRSSGGLHFDRRIARGDDRALAFARLPAGTYHVAVETREVLARRRVVLDPGGHAAIELDAAPSAELRVVVHGVLDTELNGIPAPFVVDEHGQLSGGVEPANGAKLGNFRGLLPPGHYVVTFGGEARPIDLVAGASATVEFAYRPFVMAWITLRVPDPKAHALHDEIEALVTLDRADGVRLSLGRVRATVDAQGRAQWGHLLTPGDYRVTAEFEGRVANVPLQVRAVDEEVTVELAFEP